MDAEEFWKEVKEIGDRLKNSDRTGVEFFIEDMEQLFAAWESEREENGVNVDVFMH